MKSTELPFGTQFSPKQVDLQKILSFLSLNEDVEVQRFIDFLSNTFFSGKTKTFAQNCKTSLVSYGLIEKEDTIKLTSIGKQLFNIKNDNEFYDFFALHILKELNGLILIDAIRTLDRINEKITNEKLYAQLKERGINYKPTANNIQVMKLWLEKASILTDWKINENKFESLLGINVSKVDSLKSISNDQRYYLLTLCNQSSDGYFDSAKIKELASSCYHISFPEKNFKTKILLPLEYKGFIHIKPRSDKHGGQSQQIKITDESKKHLIQSVLNQFEKIIGTPTALYLNKALTEIYNDIFSTDTHIKGLALEAFAIRIMKSIGLDFLETRLKGSQTGGAEIDAIFDSSELFYHRWQVQCKNSKEVTLEHVAKEVGLYHVLKSNVIVILTTGKITDSAREYSTIVMKETNLCIILLDGKDLSEIMKDQTQIRNILNRESLIAKKIKILDFKS